MHKRECPAVDWHDTGNRIPRDWNYAFWSVMVFSLPSFAALLITTWALVRPTEWVFALVPLIYFFIPAGLLVGAVVALTARNAMRDRYRNATWIVWGLAVLSALAALTLMLWASRRT